MKVVLFDLDGVFYEGDKAVEGAAEAVAWFQTHEVPHLFLTNTSSRPRTALVEKLAGMGIEIDEAHILTPPVAAVQWLRANTSGTAALFVPEATKAEFKEISMTESGIGAVVLGDLGEAWDFATLNRAFRLLMSESKPPLVALGMTRYWRGPDGLRLDVAPFVVALEHATGTHPVVLGKPAAPFYQAALDRLGERASNAIMVGDDIRGDVDGAQRLGIHGILVKTGKFRPSDLKLDIRPHAVLDSVADLPGWWMHNRSA